MPVKRFDTIAGEQLAAAFATDGGRLLAEVERARQTILKPRSFVSLRRESAGLVHPGYFEVTVDQTITIPPVLSDFRKRAREHVKSALFESPMSALDEFSSELRSDACKPGPRLVSLGVFKKSPEPSLVVRAEDGRVLPQLAFRESAHIVISAALTRLGGLINEASGHPSPEVVFPKGVYEALDEHLWQLVMRPPAIQRTDGYTEYWMAGEQVGPLVATSSVGLVAALRQRRHLPLIVDSRQYAEEHFWSIMRLVDASSSRNKRSRYYTFWRDESYKRAFAEQLWKLCSSSPRFAFVEAHVGERVVLRHEQLEKVNYEKSGRISVVFADPPSALARSIEDTLCGLDGREDGADLSKQMNVVGAVVRRAISRVRHSSRVMLYEYGLLPFEITMLASNYNHSTVFQLVVESPNLVDIEYLVWGHRADPALSQAHVLYDDIRARGKVVAIYSRHTRGEVDPTTPVPLRQRWPGHVALGLQVRRAGLVRTGFALGVVVVLATSALAMRPEVLVGTTPGGTPDASPYILFALSALSGLAAQSHDDLVSSRFMRGVRAPLVAISAAAVTTGGVVSLAGENVHLIRGAASVASGVAFFATALLFRLAVPKRTRVERDLRFPESPDQVMARSVRRAAVFLTVAAAGAFSVAVTSAWRWSDVAGALQALANQMSICG